MSVIGAAGRGLDGVLHLERWATQTPGSPALLAPGREELSFSGLWNLLTTVRQALDAAGVCPGEAVALVAPEGPELICALLAICGQSACAPLDPSLTEAEYRFYLSRLRARFLVIQQEVALPAVTAARELGMGVLRIRPALQSPADMFALEECAPPAGELPGRETDAALLLYTSATTGRPKLVPLTAGNVDAIAANNLRALPLDPNDRLLALMPAYHANGLAAVLTQWSCGGSVIAPPEFEPSAFPHWVDRFRPTWFTAGPAMLRAILTVARAHPEIFERAALRFIRPSGAAVEPELLEALETALRAPVLPGYGMTEAPGITRSTFENRKPGSAGQSSGCDLVILDELGNPLPPDMEGEIAVRGAAVMSGFLDDPDANHAAFRNGWLLTGDLGRLDTEGFLFITGRRKEMINRGGQKVSPGEVDAVLLLHPAVEDAAAFPVPHPTLGEEVAAAVVQRQASSVSERELRRFFAGRLAAFKVPRWIVFVDRIPRSQSGKPKRSELQDRYHRLVQTNGAAQAQESRRLDGQENRLAEIWKRILGISEVGPHDDFFRLGGDSLSAAVMLAEVQKTFAAGDGENHLADFFDDPTIASLAGKLLESRSGPHPGDKDLSPRDGLLALQTLGSQIPFFCFPASALDPYYLRHLSKGLGNDQPFYVVRPAEAVQSGRLLKIEELAALAIQAIRSVAPRGPYLIGGHCFGGVVAFEAARQLLRAGELVALLALFDVPTPGYPKVARNWKRYVIESGRVFSGLARGRLALRSGEALAHFRRLKRIVTRRFSGRSSRALAAVGSDALRAGRGEKDLNGMALWEYTPCEFSAPLVQFLAADEPVSTRILDDPRLGWREFAKNGLELRTVPGDHNSMFSIEHAPGLAAELERFLQQAGSDRAAPARAL